MFWCKFTPMGFETLRNQLWISSGCFGVNLPRWGLKPIFVDIIYITAKCKFTPLGFETYHLLSFTRFVEV